MPPNVFVPVDLLMIAIYNRHWSSPIWKWIKWLYNKAGNLDKGY